MMMIKINKKPFNAQVYFIGFALLLLLGGCLPGKRTAQKFIEQKDQVSVMIVPPSFTYLYYYPLELSDDESFDVDGAGLDQSHFLQNIDMRRADELFMESMLDQLKELNINVFTPENYTRFLNQQGQRYIFTVAQTEMVESERQHTDRALIDDVLYRQDFLIRTIDRNTWFEFVEVDVAEEDAEMKVLYSTFFTTDEIDGRFRYRAFSGEVFYEYSSFLIDEQDIYGLNSFSGKQNARYIFDFIMNRYVEQNARTFMVSPARLRYIPSDASIRRSYEGQRFIIMEP